MILKVCLTICAVKIDMNGMQFSFKDEWSFKSIYLQPLPRTTGRQKYSVLSLDKDKHFYDLLSAFICFDMTNSRDLC